VPAPTNVANSGLPTTAATASDAPLPIQSFGALPGVTPTYAQYASQFGGATVDPAQSQQYMQTAYAQNAAALQPGFAQQQQQLQDSNAARGISSSGAAGYLQGNLLGQQSSALAAADEPITSQGYSYSQADLLANQQAQQQAGLSNQGLQQQTNLANANIANAASDTNAGYYANALSGNANAYNNYLATLEQQGYNTGNEAYQTYLGSFGPNPGVQQSISGAQNAGESGFNSGYQGAVAGQNAVLGAAGAAAGAGFGGGATGSPNGDGFGLNQVYGGGQFTDAPYVL